MASLNRVQVLLDTSFILSCYEFRIHLEDIDRLVEEAHEVVVPQNVVEELTRLKQKGKNREACSIMLTILDRYRVLPLQGEADESLLKYAQEKECIVCTNDRDLRRKLRQSGRRSIFVRARSHLEMD